MTRRGAVVPVVPFPAVDGSQPCAGRDVEQFYSPDQERGSARRNRAAAAKAICEGCTFVRDCLAWALVHEPYGVWGATSEDDRAALRARHGLGVRPPELGLHPSAWRPEPTPAPDYQEDQP